MANEANLLHDTPTDIHIEYWPSTNPDVPFHYRNIDCMGYEVKDGILTAFGCNTESADTVQFPLYQVREYWAKERK